MHGDQVAGISFNFCALQILSVKGIGNFKCIFPPSIISGVPNLSRLDVEYCSMLEQVIGKDDQNVGETILFPNLKELHLSNLPNIRTFCCNNIQFPSLEYLYINECPMMLKFVEELSDHTSKPFIVKQVSLLSLSLSVFIHLFIHIVIYSYAFILL